MTDFDIGYARDWQPLERLLESVNRPGEFCTHGRLFVPMPRLVVEGAGMLSFPVPEDQVRSLIDAAERAPYGKGTETLVDTAVRDCWQIDSARIRLGGAAWASTFSSLLNAAATGLGCPAERLDAQLYKLLIYETGGFFAAHRDTEKADGMVATLSVSLPVSGTGGELAVRHRDREVRIDMNAAEPSELPYAAFYADCEHETRPVTAGYRLSLVFNLSLRPGDTETPRHAPDFADLVSPISEKLAAWSGGGPEKLVWLLEHDYSQAGLSFDALKNADASLGGVLKLAAERADCALYAAIVHIREEGTASYADGSYYDGWYGRGGDHHEAEFDEVLDGHYWLDSWAGVDGERPEFGEIALNPEELLPVGALDGAEPDEEWVNEASGNEGVTVERAYRHAAFVIWPGAATLDVLTGANILRAVAWIRNRLERDEDAGRRLLARLIGAWPETRRGTDGLKLDAQARREVLDLLTEVGDATLATHFLRGVLQGRFDGSEIDGLRNLLTLIAPGDVAECLADLVRLRFSLRPRAVLALLIRVGEMPQFRWRDALGESVRAAVAALPEALSSQREQDGGASLPRARRQRIDDAAIRDLLLLAWRCGLPGEADAAAAIIEKHSRTATPERVVPASLDALAHEEGLTGSAAFRSLWRHATDALLNRSAVPPQAPLDWVIPADLACDCEPCRQLEAFCEDPHARVGRFPFRKELRRHLHRQIDSHRLDMSHVTERRGSPYTLVCTKNRASHERRLREYAEDVDWMDALTRVAPADVMHDAVAAQLRRLKAAVEAADGAP